MAQEFCEKGLVQVNGVPARSSKELKAGDRLMIKRRDRMTEYSIESIPSQKQVSKAEAPELYKVLTESKMGEV